MATALITSDDSIAGPTYNKVITKLMVAIVLPVVDFIILSVIVSFRLRPELNNKRIIGSVLCYVRC